MVPRLRSRRLGLRQRPQSQPELAESQKAYLESVVAFGVRQARRQRAVTLGAVVILSMLVATSGGALAVVQTARSQAQEQAAVATAALEAAQLKEQQRAVAQAKEKGRAERPEEQLGSPVIDTLK